MFWTYADVKVVFKTWFYVWDTVLNSSFYLFLINSSGTCYPKTGYGLAKYLWEHVAYFTQMLEASCRHTGKTQESLLGKRDLKSDLNSKHKLPHGQPQQEWAFRTPVLLCVFLKPHSSAYPFTHGRLTSWLWPCSHFWCLMPGPPCNAKYLIGFQPF